MTASVELPTADQLLAFLDASAFMERRTRRDSPATYKGVADFLKCHGRLFPDVRDNHGLFGTPKLCFANAYRHVAVRPTWQYVEGYALPKLKGGFSIPMVHAWCVDEAGLVVDPTWTDRGAYAYFGVVFTLAQVRFARRRGSASVLLLPDCHKDGRKLYMEPFNGYVAPGMVESAATMR